MEQINNNEELKRKLRNGKERMLRRRNLFSTYSNKKE